MQQSSSGVIVSSRYRNINRLALGQLYMKCPKLTRAPSYPEVYRYHVLNHMKSHVESQPQRLSLVSGCQMTGRGWPLLLWMTLCLLNWFGHYSLPVSKLPTAARRDRLKTQDQDVSPCCLRAPLKEPIPFCSCVRFAEWQIQHDSRWMVLPAVRCDVTDGSGI